MLGALPLLYTMEMWWYGRTVAEGFLLLLYVPTAIVVWLSLLFGGFRLSRSASLSADLLIAFGIGIFVAAVTLVIVGQVQPGIDPLTAAVPMIGIEAIPCAVGAALAITQFRPRQPVGENVDRRIDALPHDAQKVLGTIVGAVFFAFNIAPTQEVWSMTMEAEPVHFPLILLFSLAASYIIVFLADFAERPAGYAGGALGTPLSETLVTYLLSLAVSYGFLAAFGHVDLSTPLEAQVHATVMLGYVTTLGGSAGRVLVAG